jgi:hypothetical protein
VLLRQQQMSEPTAKPKRTRKPKPPRPIEIYVGTEGEKVVVNDPVRLFEQRLKNSEDDVVKSLRSLVNGPDENAAVTAATKIFSHLEDSDTPGGLKAKLEPLRSEALDCLLSISAEANKSTAQAQANACLLKIMVQKAPAAWPPDTEKQEWKERFARAVSLASV